MPFTPDASLLAELEATFAVEAAEHLASLNRDLLALEKADSGDEKQRILKEIFRNAHSLKGGASAVGLQDVRALAHQLETVFGGLQREEIEVDPDLFDVLYEALDGVQRFVQEGGSDVSAHTDEVASLMSRLAELQGPDTVVAGREPGEAPRQPMLPPREDERESVSAPEMPRPGFSGVGADTVRITTSKLDELMAQVGELVVASAGSQRTAAEIAVIAHELGELERTARAQGGTTQVPAHDDLADLQHRVDGLRNWIAADARRMNQVTNQLQENVRRARMMPISTVFEAFPRMVRDLARSQGKDVRLELSGGETELDRAILEQIKAPLTHLLRNCVDHGLENPDNRVASGKPAEGTIVLSASQVGENVSIEVVDDGAGIDVDRVKAAAIGKGGLRTEDIEEMDSGQVLLLIFRSGLSTSRFITNISGRGVGLDVVRENVEALNGTIELETEVGRGTRFSLILPLTITTTRCVLVRSGGQTFGVPLTYIERTIRISPEDVRDAEGNDAIIIPGGPVPLRDLAAVLGLEAEAWQGGHRSVLLARSANRTLGLRVDEVLGIDEAVVKNLPRPLLRVRHAAGATILGSGEIVVVLNLADVVRSAVRSSEAAGVAARRSAVGDETRRVEILLADDSITTRTLEKNILASAGYVVRVAVDGEDAWKSLQADPPDLLVSDVQMPGMDGFELTAKIRADEGLKHLPIVLVTSLESETDREMGMDVGADAYIGKSSFDQEQLLDVVRRLI